MKEYSMNQCTLTSGFFYTTAWIPSKFAIVGKILNIKKDGVWQNGWTVDSVANPPKSSSYIIEHERNYLTHRQASDI